MLGTPGAHQQICPHFVTLGASRSALHFVPPATVGANRWGSLMGGVGKSRPRTSEPVVGRGLLGLSVGGIVGRC